MNNSTENSSATRFVIWLKNSLTARMFIIGALTLILLIPLVMIQELIRERAERQESVVSEINDKWGGALSIYGPVLRVPYKVYHEKKIRSSQNEVTTESMEEIKYLYIFPQELKIKSQVDPETKKRGIYQTAVYKSKIDLSGEFAVPGLEVHEIPKENILWEKARMVFHSSNLKGVNEQMHIRLGGKTYSFTSSYREVGSPSPNARKLFLMESEALKNTALSLAGNIPFQMELYINGSSEISFVPIGKTTFAEVSSNWKTSSFTGNFLPFNEDKLSGDGFNAKWKILDINRPFPQTFDESLPDLSAYSFGVNFMIPVDEYQKSERATKYGFLVIALTFLLIFLIQSLSKIAIHPFQYLMIGLGLVMFYTLLISISEHSSFLKAYGIAGASVILMISLYSKSILRTWKFPLFIGLALLALYTFIYVIIQLESYALLVGSLGLFFILAGVMFISRKIDWTNY